MEPLSTQPISGASAQHEPISDSTDGPLPQFGLPYAGAVRATGERGFRAPLWPAALVAGKFCGDPDLRGFLLQSRQLDSGGPNQRPRTQRAEVRRQEHQGRLSLCAGPGVAGSSRGEAPHGECPEPCLLYTSDAADEEDSVDLGGRRIIKKKK